METGGTEWQASQVSRIEEPNTASPGRTGLKGPDADLRLVRLVLSGSSEALKALMERMRCVPRILAAKNARLGSPLSSEELEDVVQDTLIHVWRRLPDYAGLAALETWVYTFCHHRLCKALEARGRRLVISDVEAEEPAVWPREAFAFEHVHQALERLPQEEADVLRLKHFRHLTFSEIGSALEVSPNTAKTRYYRGIDRLRELLEPTWEAER